jgi:hypothetical protein
MESDEKRLGSVSNVLVEKEDLVHGDLQVGGICDCICCIPGWSAAAESIAENVQHRSYLLQPRVHGRPVHRIGTSRSWLHAHGAPYFPRRAVARTGGCGSF